MSVGDLLKKRSSFGRHSPSQPKTLSFADRESLVAVLEDSVDQLAILGGIMPDFNDKPSAAEEVLGAELAQIIETQRAIEAGGMDLVGDSNRQNAHAVFTAAAASTNTKTVTANMEKLEEDRQYLQDVLSQVKEEVGEQGTFASLTKALQQYHSEKERMRQIIQREEECRKRMKLLKKNLVTVKKQKEQEVAELNEKIAYLKDELQETKAETGLMSKQTQKEAAMEVECDRRHKQITESQLESEIARFQQKLQEENLVSHETEEYLKKHAAELEVKVEEWMARYEEDTEAKSKELEDIKQSRESNLQELQELAEKFQECDKVVTEYKEQMAKIRLKEEQEEKRKQMAVKVQAWWRGMLVRKCLGPYAKPKKKDKKKKGGKKKKKK